MKQFTDANFEQEVMNKSELVVIDFWAPWCGPCKMLTPIFEELNNEYGDKVVFGKVNVDENPSIANKFRIASIPTLIFMKDGQIVENLVGFRPKQEIDKIINENL